MSLHSHALAFDRGADDYERGRPGYPFAISNWMQTQYRLSPTNSVLDLGAGTGKLTRLLCEASARVVAVEPLVEMRRVFSRLLPDVEVHGATAESMPFAEESFDLVTCGQSFRWFATESAGVHHPFGNSLVVEVKDLPSEMGVLEKRGAPLPNSKRVLIVRDHHALLCCQQSSAIVGLWWVSLPAPRSKLISPR